MIKMITAYRVDALFVCALLLAISCSSSTTTTRESDSGKDIVVDSSTKSEAGVQAVCIRPVLTTYVTNARDIGNWPLPGDKYVTCRRIMRGGTLVSLNEAGCAEFAELGIQTVVDTREASVQDSSPPPECVTTEARQILAPMPKILPDTPDNYLALMDQGEAVRTIFETLGEAEFYPVYIHCEIGRDRTNFIVALILLALGADKETIVEEFQLSEAADVPVKPECIEAVIDEVERRGGIESVLQGFGVSETAIEVLRAQLISE